MEHSNKQNYCTSCGSRIGASDRFCERCGKSLEFRMGTDQKPPAYLYSKTGTPFRTNKKTDVYCIAGIVLSWYAVFSYIIAPVFSIAGIAVSVLGMRRVKLNGQDGKNLALAGIILGVLGLLVYTLILLGLLRMGGSMRTLIPFNTVQV